MSEPFIFIATYTFKEGKSEEFKKGSQEFCEFIEANEPRLIAFHLYTNEDGTELTVVQVHPDAESMLFHMNLIRQHLESAGDTFDETKSIQVYGTPSGGVLDMIQELSQSGVPLTVRPGHIGGFTRSAADRIPAAS